MILYLEETDIYRILLRITKKSFSSLLFNKILPFKFIKQFVKEKEKGAFQGGIFLGNWIDAAEANQLADLPGKDELRAKLVFLINSPLQGLHYSLSYNLTGLINILKQKAEQSV